MKTHHLFLVGQKIPGCSSEITTWQTILWGTWQMTTCMKVLWRRQWKTSSDFLDGKRDFKDLRRVHHKIRAPTSSIPNLSWQLITGELQHWKEGRAKVRTLLTCFCQGKSLSHYITASGNHSQILLSKCFLSQRISLFNIWNASKPPLIFKIKKIRRAEDKGADTLLKLAIPSSFLWLPKELGSVIKVHICTSIHQVPCSFSQLYLTAKILALLYETMFTFKYIHYSSFLLETKLCLVFISLIYILM